jgi:hypothetical protein
VGTFEMGAQMRNFQSWKLRGCMMVRWTTDCDDPAILPPRLAVIFVGLEWVKVDGGSLMSTELGAALTSSHKSSL